MCQWRRDFPQKWRRKIPQSGGLAISRWRDRRLRFLAAAATFQGRRNGIGGRVRLEADRLGQEVGVFAQPIAGALDLDDDGVVKEPVEEGGGDDGIAEYRRTPPFLIGWCRRSRSRTHATSYSGSVLGAALPTWLSSWLTDASVRSGLPQRTSFRQETHRAQRSPACPVSVSAP